LTPIGRRARAGSTSTKPRRRCALRTNRPASLSRARTSARNCKTRGRAARAARPAGRAGRA
jgi:hypothetical protein